MVSSENLRIAMLCPYFAESVGGAEISTQLFVNEINKKEIKVEIISNKTIKNSKYNIKQLKFFNVLSPMWRSFLLNTNLFDNYLSIKLFKLLNKINPNIIHVQDILMLPASVKVAKKLKIPIIVTIRDARFVCNLAVCKEKGDLFFNCSNKQYLNCLKKTSQNSLGLKMFAYFLFPFLRTRSKTLISSLKRCNKIVSVSNYVKNNLIRAGIPKEQVQTNYNLIPKWDINIKKNKELRKNFGKNKFIIFASGRLVNYKGFQVLIKAIANIVNSNKWKKILVLIAGEGSYREELEELVNKLELNEYIKFIGKLSYDEIKNYYSMCDVVVIPSLWQEPLSRIIYDSIGAKKPVIIADVGGNKEIFSKEYKLIFNHSKGLDFNKLLEYVNKEKNYYKSYKDFNKINIKRYIDVYLRLIE